MKQRPTTSMVPLKLLNSEAEGIFKDARGSLGFGAAVISAGLSY
jgi:hypothetical protein